MLAFSWLHDLLFAVVLFLVAIAITWYFLYRTKQVWVSVSSRRTVWIAIRLFSVVAIFYGMCAATGFAMWVPLVILVGLAVLSLNGQTPIGYPAFFVWIVVLHFVLGFPATGELILQSPLNSDLDDANAKSKIESESRKLLVGRRAITITALRPIGTLEIDGVVYDATTELGRFVDADTEVLVTSADKPCLLVQVLSA
jgi:membrane-bound ClpP family serine protease